MDEQSKRILSYYGSFKEIPRYDIEKNPPICPAAFAVACGRKTGHPGVVCGVDGSYVDSVTSPTAFYSYCTRDYQNCPAWQEANVGRVDKKFDPSKTKH